MSDLYERSAAVMPPFALHKMPFGIDHASGSYLYTDEGTAISTRAPTRGATNHRAMLPYPLPDFYSRPYARGDSNFHKTTS